MVRVDDWAILVSAVASCSGCVRPSPRDHSPVTPLPRTTTGLWLLMSGLNSESAFSKRSTSAFGPVRSVQLRDCPNCADHLRSRSGVSVEGSTLMEINCTVRPSPSFKRLESLAKLAPIGRQIVVQVVKIVLMATAWSLSRSLTKCTFSPNWFTKTRSGREFKLGMSVAGLDPGSSLDCARIPPPGVSKKRTINPTRTRGNRRPIAFNKTGYMAFLKTRTTRLFLFLLLLRTLIKLTDTLSFDCIVIRVQ